MNQEFFDKYCEYTNSDKDYVSLDALFAIFCLTNKVSKKQFKYAVSRFMVNGKFVFYPVKYIDGKNRCNIILKTKLL